MFLVQVKVLQLALSLRGLSLQALSFATPVIYTYQLHGSSSHLLIARSACVLSSYLSRDTMPHVPLM